MSSVQHLREFIRERLTAAAEEIFSEVEKTIVRYEEDVRLLGTCWKPQIKLTRIVGCFIHGYAARHMMLYSRGSRRCFLQRSKSRSMEMQHTTCRAVRSFFWAGQIESVEKGQ
ncbi:hypothetical protein ATANTOWER_022895 [Ataeniobius toweri]|uniref:Uncharacterized protein n=1 Tax=Ataeniobius toweri TaxID=208326 RepID=A0ABU7CA34_9TELE|nr:hypothetical protein [Ataeniobius toweri]